MKTDPPCPVNSFSLSGLLSAAVCIAAVGSVLGFFGAWCWFFDLFAHFRVQYFFGFLVIGAWHLFQRKRAWALACLALSVLNLAVILPFYLPRAVLDDINAPFAIKFKKVSAMLMNVNRDYGNPEKVLAAVRTHQPDFVVLEEIDNGWFDFLAPGLTETYPHHVTELRSDNFGIGLWSKYPIVNHTILYSGDWAIPTIIADLDFLPWQPRPGRLTVIATHPVPPVRREMAHARDAQLAELAQHARNAKHPLLLIGDLNATPWCAAFRKLQRDSGLVNSAQGRGLYPSWPAFFPAFLRIPIDHVLHTPDIKIIERKTGPRVGSDHLPVTVDFYCSQ